MSDRFDFWTNGIATVMENPELARSVRRRTDTGLEVQQEGGTGAWFHIPIPTPSVLEGDSTTAIRFFALVAEVNQNATIDRLDVRRGTDLLNSQRVSFTGRIVNQVFEMPDTSTSVNARTGAGIAISLHVTFLTGTPRGKINLLGAGAAFS